MWLTPEPPEKSPVPPESPELLLSTEPGPPPFRSKEEDSEERRYLPLLLADHRRSRKIKIRSYSGSHYFQF